MSEHSYNGYLAGDIQDADTDMLVIKLPTPGDVTIDDVYINSLGEPEGGETISIENQAEGAGSSIEVTFSGGVFYAENSGALTVTEFLWVRIRNIGNLYGLNVSLNYTRA